MKTIVGIPMTRTEQTRVVPKLFYTLEDVNFALSSPDTVTRMRKQGFLKPFQAAPMLFDAADLLRACERWKEYVGKTEKVKPEKLKGSES